MLDWGALDWGWTTAGPEEKGDRNLGPPPAHAEWYGPAGLRPWGGGAASCGGTMGLRAGGALGGMGAGRMGAGRGAPEGPEPSSGAQGGSIHSGCIATVHNVPLSVLIRPLPSVLDPAKVQSLVDTIRVRPRGGQGEGRLRRREVALDARGDWFQTLPKLSSCCVTLNK